LSSLDHSEASGSEPAHATMIPSGLTANSASIAATTRLRLLSYNIQIGAATKRMRHYVTQSWKHVLPHSAVFANLDHIANLIRGYDIVALQEVDAGSVRSRYINQLEYLARKAHFPYWYAQTTRNLGRFAQHSNGFLSRLQPRAVSEHRLPSKIPGRGLITVRYGSKGNPLHIMIVHLALGRRTRLKQIAYICELIATSEHVVLMGDFNCRLPGPEFDLLFSRTSLSEPTTRLHTFPSWRPYRNIDHILVTPSLRAGKVKALNSTYSDHLPIALELEIPESILLSR